MEGGLNAALSQLFLAAKTQEDSKEIVYVSRIFFFECVNVLALLEQRWLSAFSNFPHILVGCATLSRCSLSLRLSAAGAAAAAAAAGRPFVFGETLKQKEVGPGLTERLHAVNLL